MLKKNSDGIYESSLLLEIPGLTHGFSSRRHGDMRKKRSQELFLEKLRLSDLVSAEQVHGDRVENVSADDIGKEITGADGLVCHAINLALCIRTADCVPILAVDPKTKIIGAIHAGWRGTLANISKNLITEMTKLGARSKDIFVVIGPHICGACYDVDDDRARKFLKIFPSIKIIQNQKGKNFLDLGKTNFYQLIESGVPENHIDLSSICTYGEKEDFFSYRRDAKSDFGEFLGIIAYGKN